MKWTKSTFVQHPAGVFTGKFIKWQPRSSEEFGEQVELSFETDEEMEDGKPFTVSSSGSWSLGPKSKVTKFLKAIGVDSADVDENTFDLDDYLRAKCQLVIEEYTGRDGSTKTKIANWLPLKKRGAKAEAKEETRELVGAGAAARQSAFADDED